MNNESDHATANPETHDTSSPTSSPTSSSTSSSVHAQTTPDTQPENSAHLSPQKLYILERKEARSLLTLSIVTGLSSFTLGVHLGKQVTPARSVTQENRAHSISSAADPLPSTQEMMAPNKTTQQALDDVLNQGLHEEVNLTAIHLNATYQTDLPDTTKGRNGGETTTKMEALKSLTPDLEKADRKITSEKERDPLNASNEEPQKKTHFTLQIGSYASSAEAQDALAELEIEELKPLVREVETPDQRKRFRIYAGEFSSEKLAETTGKSYRSQRKIKSFIVSKISD
ncbi:MAG: SPOR domain-containing protein [Bdellovibrionia bacterium]